MYWVFAIIQITAAVIFTDLVSDHHAIGYPQFAHPAPKWYRHLRGCESKVRFSIRVFGQSFPFRTEGFKVILSSGAIECIRIKNDRQRCLRKYKV